MCIVFCVIKKSNFFFKILLLDKLIECDYLGILVELWFILGLPLCSDLNSLGWFTTV